MESDYKIVRELGKGAFGTVYLIKHKREAEWFALKTVDLSRADAKERASAEREANLMRELNHDHVVRYVASTFNGSTLFIFTEYCEGGDLSHFLEDTSGKLPEDLIVCWVYQTAEALKYLHHRKILHRDLKPQNIYLSGEGDIKLGDLGIARILDKGADMASTMAGTPCYMSPEIFQMKGYNHKTDIWSFGCVVYEMAAGERAFDAPIFQFLMFKVVAGVVPPIHSDYSDALRRLVKSMMAKDPDQRPSAADLLERSPVKEFGQSPQRPKEIMKTRGFRTKWGTSESTVDTVKLFKEMVLNPAPPFKDGDIRIPVDSLQVHRERLGLKGAASAVPTSGSGGAGIYGSIMAPKQKAKEKVADKKIEVTLKPERSRTEMSEGRAAIMEAVMRGLMGKMVETQDRTLRESYSSTSSSSDSDFDSTLGASHGTTTKKAIEAQFLMRQIQVLQKHCAEGLGTDTLQDAYSILESVTDAGQLKARLVTLIGEDMFRQYGEKIMYLRLFQVGLDKVRSQME
ncbi:serine/threonine-protein kinase Nek6-like [Haliotis rubra]|uniref:serine/threonine-protein kinase Nek6-like n=1 Tax=Haliotis rubra TaxID=36100 RepID=UPI001EE58D4A|nr:serine/threonine-protein kinase Nek6-like [Haliotis rubra]